MKLLRSTPPSIPASSPSSYAGENDSSVEARIIQRFGKVSSALDSGTSVQGKLRFDLPVRIDGKLSGEISAARSLVVGRTGEVEAQIKAGVLIIMGKVKGDIEATDRVEILAGGAVEGTIRTPVLVLEEGCLFNGTCSMEKKIPKSPETRIIELGEEAPLVEGPTEAEESRFVQH